MEKKIFNFFCDLRQVETEKHHYPSVIIRNLVKLGTILDLKIDLGQQEIRDGDIIEHPVMNCQLESYKDLSEIQAIFSEDFYVIDEVHPDVLEGNDDSPKEPNIPLEIHQTLDELRLISFQQHRITDWHNPQAKANCEYLQLVSQKLLKLHKMDQMAPIQILLEYAEDQLHHLAQESGKDLSLWTTGGEHHLEEYLIDKLVVIFKETLNFFVNESIETAGERQTQGKPSGSQLRLRVSKFDDKIELALSCDGKNPQQENLASLLASIKPQLDSINGKLSFSTNQEQGFQIKLMVHETISQIPCEVFSWKNQTFALPTFHIKSCFAIEPEVCDDVIEPIGHHFYLNFGERKTPCIFLEDILNYNRRFTKETYQHIYQSKQALKGRRFKAFELDLGFKRFAFIVEAETSLEHVTISQKPCPPLIVFSGKGVTQDGSSALILDVFSIGEHALDLNIRKAS